MCVCVLREREREREKRGESERDRDFSNRFSGMIFDVILCSGAVVESHSWNILRSPLVQLEMSHNVQREREGGMEMDRERVT